MDARRHLQGGQRIGDRRVQQGSIAQRFAPRGVDGSEDRTLRIGHGYPDPQPLARRLFEAIFPLMPSNAERPGRSLPRLQLGTMDPWAVALGAAAEPIRRAFDPLFSAILKEAS